jgi:hypothetical protein
MVSSDHYDHGISKLKEKSKLELENKNRRRVSVAGRKMRSMEGQVSCQYRDISDPIQMKFCDINCTAKDKFLRNYHIALAKESLLLNVTICHVFFVRVRLSIVGIVQSQDVRWHSSCGYNCVIAISSPAAAGDSAQLHGSNPGLTGLVNLAFKFLLVDNTQGSAVRLTY